jgi:hypothetical protein
MADLNVIHRDDARAHAQAGIALLARAFNHCGRGELAHRYTDEVQSRFIELATELVALVECGAVESNPAHGPYLMGKAARENEPLQALLHKLAATPNASNLIPYPKGGAA